MVCCTCCTPKWIYYIALHQCFTVPSGGFSRFDVNCDAWWYPVMMWFWSVAWCFVCRVIWYTWQYVAWWWREVACDDLWFGKVVRAVKGNVMKYWGMRHSLCLETFGFILYSILRSFTCSPEMSTFGVFLVFAEISWNLYFSHFRQVPTALLSPSPRQCMLTCI